jgi:hypothetical protein
MMSELHAARVARRAAVPSLASYVIGSHAIKISAVPGAAIGSIVWEGSVVLAKHLAAHPELIVGLRVLELGSGLGLVGIAAAYLGASSVTLTDTEGLLPLLRGNISHNANVAAICAAAELSWGLAGWDAFCARVQSVPLSTFDVILASDVVYRDDSATLLVDTLCQAIPRGSTSECFMSYKERGSGAFFFGSLHAQGFESTVLEERREPGDEHCILRISRASPPSEADLAGD